MATNEQISITLSFRKEDSALIQVQQQVNSFMSTLQKGMTLGIGMRLADGILAIPGQLRSAITAGVDYATTMRNMALETRMTASSFQVISLLSTQYGVQVNLLATAIQHMSTVTGQAVDGNAKMADVFHRLGINAQEFSQLSVPQQLERLAQAAAQASWSSQALNDVAEVLGKRSAPQLEGVLHSLAANGFGAISQAAADAGAVLSDQLDAEVAEIGNKWKKTGQIWKVTSAEFVEYLKPMLDAANELSNLVAKLFQRILLGSQLMAADIKAVWQTLIGFLHGQEGGGGDFWKRAVNNMDIVGAKVNAKWTPTVTEKSSGGLAPQQSEAASKKAADEVARLSAEYAALKQRADEAVMSANAKMVDLATHITAANKAIMDYGRGHSGDMSNDPEFIKLQIAKEKLQIAFQTAQKESEHAAQEQQDAADRAAKMDKEKADRAALAQFDADQIPLKEKLRSIEQDRSLITQNNLIDSVTKQARLNDNAEQYRQTIAKIIALEIERLKIATDPREVARLKADITAQGGDSARYGVSQKPATKEQKASSDLNALSDPANHFQSARGGLIAGMQEYATRIGTLGDQINSKFQNIAQTVSGSISSGIEGLINRTESWRSALGNIASAIEGAVINAIVQMGVEWVTQQIMMAVVGKSIAAASLAANAGIAMAQSAIWAAPATLATIASYGGAAVAAPVEIAGAMLATLGMALASEGGVFDGDPTKPRGIFHGGEGILTNRTMQMRGMAEFVNAMNAGDHVTALTSLAGSTMGRLGARGSGVAQARAGTQGASLGVVVSDDRQGVARQMRSRDGRKAIIDSVRNDRGLFFL